MQHIDSLVLASRSCRAFDASKPITREIMTELVDLARRCPSGMNRQPLRYRILSDCEEILTMLGNCRFGGQPGAELPAEQRPTGFILLFRDTKAESPEELSRLDAGIAAQTILLAATERGFGGCMLASFDPERLCRDFDISPRYTPYLAIALGTPNERIRLTDPRGGALGYYRDAEVRYVPKLPLEDVLI